MRDSRRLTRAWSRACATALLWVLGVASACLHQPGEPVTPVEGLEVYEKGADGDVVVFLPGLGADVRQFRADVDALAGTYRALAMSMRGHGRSFRVQAIQAGTNPYTPAHMADDVLAELDRRGIERAHFVGNSMGGLVAYAILEKRPDRMLSLATFGTTAELHRGGALACTVVTMARLLGPGGMGEMTTSASQNDEASRLMAAMIRRTSEDALVHAAEAIADYDHRALLAHTRVPYLLLVGEHDDNINAELTSSLVVLKTRAHTSIRHLSGVGHLANLERPSDVRRELALFWDSIENGPPK